MIFRVEKHGLGPYKRQEHVEMYEAHSWCDNHPSVRTDVKGWRIGLLSGFQSAKHMRRWFGRYLKELLNMGYKVKKFKIKKKHVLFSVSGKQIAFDRNDVL